MKRLLAFAFVLLAAPVSAQIVVPQTVFPPGVTPIVFGAPAVNGSNITPATVGVDASTCSAPGIYLKTATTTGIAFTATPSVILCVNGSAILTSSSTAVTSTVPITSSVAGSNFTTTKATSAASVGYEAQNTAVSGADWIYGTGSTAFGTASAEDLVLAYKNAAGSGSTGAKLAVTAAGATLLDSIIFDITNKDVSLSRGAANTLDQKNGTNAQTYRYFGYTSGSRSTFESIASVTTAVTLSGASTSTGNVIPAGATVVDIATSTTTTITGASGYTVGDGSDVDRYGDITGTAVGTNSGSTNYTADPRWWTNAARAVILTAKTSNFTGGVVQVTVFYRSATGS